MTQTAKKSSIKISAVSAFGHTVPVMVCYVFMGIAAGLMLSSKGYSFAWSTFLSASVLSGTMQFVGNELLITDASLVYTAIMTLMVNFRYMFYGISMLEKFSDFKKLRPYMIFTLTDETYSLLYSVKPPEGANKKLLMLFIAFFDHIYWIIGCTLGAAAGSLSFFNADGIDFVMTALFITILIDQWKEKGGRLPAIIGLTSTALCLIILPRDVFLIAAIIMIMTTLTVFKKKIDPLFGESI